jgi:hypothetical protein
MEGWEFCAYFFDGVCDSVGIWGLCRWLVGWQAGRQAGRRAAMSGWWLETSVIIYAQTNERTLKETLHSPNSTRWWTTARSALCVCLFCARLLDTYTNKQTNTYAHAHTHIMANPHVWESVAKTRVWLQQGPNSQKKQQHTHTQAHLSVEYECGGLVMGFWPATPQPGGGAIPRRRAEGARARIL